MPKPQNNIHIICGQCGRRYDFDEPPASNKIACTGCGRTILLNASQKLGISDNSAWPDSDCDGGFAGQARQSLRRRMFVLCANCGQRIKITRRMAGRVIRCESCSQSIRVPSMDDEASAWASGADTNFDPNQAVHDLQKVLAPGEHLVHSAKAHAWAGRVAFWLLLAGLLAAAVAVMIWLMPHISSDAASELSLHKITYRKVYPRK